MSIFFSPFFQIRDEQTGLESSFDSIQVQPYHRWQHEEFTEGTNFIIISLLLLSSQV